MPHNAATVQQNAILESILPQESYTTRIDLAIGEALPTFPKTQNVSLHRLPNDLESRFRDLDAGVKGIALSVNKKQFHFELI